jgi:hypothetical protein
MVGLALLAIAMSGCDKPDLEFERHADAGESVHVRSYRLGGSVYWTTLMIISPHAAKYVVQIVDTDVVGPASVLKESVAEAEAGQQIYVDLIAHLSPSTNLIVLRKISVLSQGAPPIAVEADQRFPGRVILRVAFGPWRVKYWFLGTYSIWIWPALVGVSFLLLWAARRLELRPPPVLMVPAGDKMTERPQPLQGRPENRTGFPPAHWLDEYRQQELQQKLVSEVESTRKLASHRFEELEAMQLETRESLSRRIEERSQRVASELSQGMNALQDEVSRLKQLPLREARVLDTWAREGVIRRGFSREDKERWRIGVLLCQLGNDLLAAGNQRIDLRKVSSDRFAEFPGISLDWVSLQQAPGGPRRITVKREADYGAWLACEIPADGSKLLVPTPHRFTVADKALLHLLFQGADESSQVSLAFAGTSDDFSTLRVFKPAVLQGMSGKRSLLAQGRILVGDSQLSLAEHIILLLENALMTASAIAPETTAAGPPDSASTGQPIRTEVVSGAKAKGGDGGASSLLSEMPAAWWQSALEKAIEGGTEPKEYLVRVILAEENLGAVMSGLSGGWQQKLVWVRFDVEDDCLVVTELVKLGIAEVGPVNSENRPGAALQGRDLYQVAVIVVEPTGKRALVFLPLGEFLLDNHVTVLSRLIDNPPSVPSYIKQIVRPAIIERLKGKNYRILPQGQMQVELRVEN